MVTVTTFIWVVLSFFILIGLICVAVIVAWKMTQRVQVREPSSKGSYVLGNFWVFRSKDKKTGNIIWKSVPWQKKLRLINIPDTAWTIGKGGFKFAVAYKLDDIQYVYAKEDYEIKIVKDKKGNVKPELNIGEVNIKPFTAVQREVLVNQEKRALEKIQKGFLTPEFVLPAISVMGLVTVLIVGAVFWSDIWGPVMNAGSTYQQIQEENVKLLQQITILASRFEGNSGSVAIARTEQVQQIPQTQDETQPQNSSGG